MNELEKPVSLPPKIHEERTATPEEVGAETERRFFAAFQDRDSETPGWFRWIKRAKLSLDIRGVDATATIYPKDDPESTKVPLQIKSSERGKVEYEQTMPTAQAHNVVIIVVTTAMTESEIRATTFAKLKPIHESGKRFGPFYKEVWKQSFTAKKRHKLIELARAIQSPTDGHNKEDKR